jgi:chitinase
MYLFHATPNSNGSGAFVFEYGNAVNSSEIQTVRSRGQRVVLTVGGANAGFNFQTRTQSQNFVNSFVSIVNSLGGQLDGIDFNNFEAGIAPSPTEMIWIARELKARYGSNFSVSSPPAPWSAQDLALSKAMVEAGVLDYAGPQFYDDAGLVIPSTIVSYVDKWVTAMGGDPSKVVVGFGSNYSAGSNMAQVQQAWDTIKQKYPTIRGAFGWSAENDRNAGWTFGTYFLNNK